MKPLDGKAFESLLVRYLHFTKIMYKAQDAGLHSRPSQEDEIVVKSSLMMQCDELSSKQRCKKWAQDCKKVHGSDMNTIIARHYRR